MRNAICLLLLPPPNPPPKGEGLAWLCGFPDGRVNRGSIWLFLGEQGVCEIWERRSPFLFGPF